MGDYVRAKVGSFVRSKTFFGLTLLVFLLSSSWIALSGRFSMAYDENTHFNTIQIYSQRWTPFWGEAHSIGSPIGHDPSYIYQFLLSFPYRLMDNFVHSTPHQVIALRFISIGIFLAGIVIFRRLLLAVRAPRGLVHLALAIFVLTPGVPFLAAQINYDNLLFLITGVAILLTLRFTERLRQTNVASLGRLGVLLAVCLLGSLVKFAFLPIFGAILLWLIYAMYRYGGFKNYRQALQVFTGLRPALRIGLVALLLFSSGLFFERYGVNTISYHTPTPECDQILSVAKCQTQSSWKRNYDLRQKRLAGLQWDRGPYDPVTYTYKHWLRRMSYELVFALNGRTDYFKVGTPFPLPRLLGMALFAVGIVLTAYWYRFLHRRYEVNLLLLAIVLYVGALWTQEYLDFVHLGEAVAIQGRYLIPVLPLIIIIIGLAYRKALKNLPNFKMLLAAMSVAILLLQGGGATTYILRSDQRWYWPNNKVIEINQAAQKVLRPIVVDS